MVLDCIYLSVYFSELDYCEDEIPPELDQIACLFEDYGFLVDCPEDSLEKNCFEANIFKEEFERIFRKKIGPKLLNDSILSYLYTISESLDSDFEIYISMEDKDCNDVVREKYIVQANKYIEESERGIFYTNLLNNPDEISEKLEVKENEYYAEVLQETYCENNNF